MSAEAELQVEARVDAEGPPQPMAFSWHGRRYRISSFGRAWRDAEEHHYLVMAWAPKESGARESERVFELAYSLESGTWRLVREPGDFGPPGGQART